MFSVKINGFRSLAEAGCFLDWYEGQGEQDAQVWFECRKDEGEIDRDFIGVDCSKPYIIEGNIITAWVKE